MEKIVSLLYNKDKASYVFFGKNVNKSVHFFVYGDLCGIYGWRPT